MAKPRIFLTRRWPEAVQARLARNYEASFNNADAPMGPEAISRALGEYDAVLPTVSDSCLRRSSPRRPERGSWATSAWVTITSTSRLLRPRDSRSPTRRAA